MKAKAIFLGRSSPFHIYAANKLFDEGVISSVIFEEGKSIFINDNIKVIKLNPKYANAFYNLAGLFLEKGDLLQAEINFRRAIELKSDFAIAHYNLGLILKNLGKLQEAKLYIQTPDQAP